MKYANDVIGEIQDQDKGFIRIYDPVKTNGKKDDAADLIFIIKLETDKVEPADHISIY